MQWQPPGDTGVVDHRSGSGKPLQEEHVFAVENAQLYMVADHVVDPLHERHGRVAQG